MAILYCAQCGKEHEADSRTVAACSCGGKAFVAVKPSIFEKPDERFASTTDKTAGRALDYKKAAFQSE